MKKRSFFVYLAISAFLIAIGSIIPFSDDDEHMDIINNDGDVIFINDTFI